RRAAELVRLPTRVPAPGDPSEEASCEPDSSSRRPLRSLRIPRSREKAHSSVHPNGSPSTASLSTSAKPRGSREPDGSEVRVTAPRYEPAEARAAREERVKAFIPKYEEARRELHKYDVNDIVRHGFV